MSGYAALQGFAEGLRDFYFVPKLEEAKENRKSALRDKLEQEKESREEQRTISREQRAADRESKKIENTRVLQRDGAYTIESLNSQGDVIKSEPADPDTIGKLQRANQREEKALKKADLDILKTQQEVEAFPSEQSLQRRLKESQVSYNEARGQAALSGGSAKSDKFSAPSRTSLQSYFSTPSADDPTKSVVDPEKVKAFNVWRAENPEVKNGEQALVQYAGEQEAESSLQSAAKDMRANHLPEYLINQKINAAREGEEDMTQTPTTKGFNQKQTDMYNTGLKAINNARRLISEGKITKEEAKRQLIDRGYPRLAEQLR